MLARIVLLIDLPKDIENHHPELFIPFFCQIDCSNLQPTNLFIYLYTVKLGNKERFDKEQIDIKELITDYQTFYTINLLLDKELLPI